MENQMDTGNPLKKDEDAKFEQIIELAEGGQHPAGEEQAKQSMVEGTLPAKEDTLGNSDFPPLSEKDKQPKLQEEDRIEEMNRKTSLED